VTIPFSSFIAVNGCKSLDPFYGLADNRSPPLVITYPQSCDREEASVQALKLFERLFERSSRS